MEISAKNEMNRNEVGQFVRFGIYRCNILRGSLGNSGHKVAFTLALLHVGTYLHVLIYTVQKRQTVGTLTAIPKRAGPSLRTPLIHCLYWTYNI